jgi:hypothetical protein
MQVRPPSSWTDAGGDHRFDPVYCWRGRLPLGFQGRHIVIANGTFGSQLRRNTTPKQVLFRSGDISIQFVLRLHYPIDVSGVANLAIHSDVSDPFGPSKFYSVRPGTMLAEPGLFGIKLNIECLKFAGKI